MLIRALLAGVAASFLATAAMANSVVLFDFTGQSTSGPGSISGTLSYDTAATPTASIPTANAFAEGQIDFTVTGDAFAGTYSLFSSSTGVNDRAFSMSLGPSGGTLFRLTSSTAIRSDFSLPDTLDLSDADSEAFLDILAPDIGLGSPARIRYSLTSLTQTQFVTHQPTVIPLPAGLPLMLTGFLGLLLARRRNRAA